MIPAINLYATNWSNYSIWICNKSDYMYFVRLFATWIENGWIPCYMMFKKDVGGCICLTELNSKCDHYVISLVREYKWYKTILLTSRGAEGQKVRCTIIQVKVRSSREIWVDQPRSHTFSGIDCLSSIIVACMVRLRNGQMNVVHWVLNSITYIQLEEKEQEWSNQHRRVR